MDQATGQYPLLSGCKPVLARAGVLAEQVTGDVTALPEILGPGHFGQPAYLGPQEVNLGELRLHGPGMLGQNQAPVNAGSSARTAHPIGKLATPCAAK